MSGRLELSGALEVSLDDRTIAVTGSGPWVRAEIAALDGVRPTLRMARSGLVLARRLSRALDRAELRLVITRNGRTLAELGAGVRGGRFSRLFGLSRVRISWLLR
jgi:hypothetical protein